MEIGQSVTVKGKKLSEARFHGFSKSGKRVAVLHNAAAPYGVAWRVSYFKPENVEGK